MAVHLRQERSLAAVDILRGRVWGGDTAGTSTSVLAVASSVATIVDRSSEQPSTPTRLTTGALELAVGSFRSEVAPPRILWTCPNLPEQAACHQTGKPRAGGASAQPNRGGNLVGEQAG